MKLTFKTSSWFKLLLGGRQAINLLTPPPVHL